MTKKQLEAELERYRREREQLIGILVKTDGKPYLRCTEQNRLERMAHILGLDFDYTVWGLRIKVPNGN